jgi:hypothetical protein
MAKKLIQLLDGFQQIKRDIEHGTVAGAFLSYHF